MRIIAGDLRSRRILSPPDTSGGGGTRPITDRVKQSLFDRLVALEQMGGNVLDLFAGTGSLGLEALSRGADHCAFVERDRTARALLERNVSDLGLTDRATVFASDALAATWLPMLTHTPLRVIFCDPPYPMTRDPATLARLAQLLDTLAGKAEDDGVLVLRTDRRTAAPPAPAWTGPESFTYGSMTLHFYRKTAKPQAAC